MLQIVPLQLEGIEYWGLIVQRKDGRFDLTTYMSRERALHDFNRIVGNRAITNKGAA